MPGVYRKRRKKASNKSAAVLIIFLMVIIALAGLFFIYRDKCEKMIYSKQYPIKYERIVKKYAREYSLEESMIYAVIRTESNFDEKAVSRANAKGLMQITDETFHWITSKHTKDDREKIEDIFDPDVNIKYGCKALRMFLNEFEIPETSYAAYNAGRGIVNKWLKNEKYSSDGRNLTDIPYNETRHYVKKVSSAKKMYDELYFNKNKE